MVYFTYIINLITNIMTSIVIPIPFSTDKVYYLSIFSIITGIMVFAIIIYFVSKLLGIEINMFWNTVADDLSKNKKDNNGYSKIYRTVNKDGTNNYTVYNQKGEGRIGKDTWRVKNK